MASVGIPRLLPSKISLPFEWRKQVKCLPNYTNYSEGSLPLSFPKWWFGRESCKKSITKIVLDNKPTVFSFFKSAYTQCRAAVCVQTLGNILTRNMKKKKVFFVGLNINESVFTIV
jgi:hypothetical protein